MTPGARIAAAIAVLDQIGNGQPAEQAVLAAPHDLTDAARCDVPDWLWPHWRDSLGDKAESAALAQQARAEVFLRVNRRRGTPDDAQSALADEGIATAAHDMVAGCLRVLSNPRRVKIAAAYLEGLVELQDASSQYAVQQVPVSAGARLLDYCAGYLGSDFFRF
jgi:16S rRNA (cytosine967-C5)-methyltransferase